MLERSTEVLIDNILVNKGWILDTNNKNKNVFHQEPRTAEEKKKLKGKRPDYILYKDEKPIAIIEAKKGGKPLKEAMKQATEYAEMLEAPLIFASNGAYVETSHLIKRASLLINGEKVDKIINYKEAIDFIQKGDNEIYTIPKELIKSKEDLIKIFKNVNNLLRKANVFSGYDRISEFSSILFLKLISEQEGEKSYWNSIKKQDDEFLFSYLNGTVIKQLENKYGGGVFSEINIKKPSLLRQIVEMIDPLILSDIKTDIKGDAFEYFLKNMNQADNDLGQYFTPRHIVKAMVHLVNPKFKETVYDPFCGTGGFLTESFNHIKENSIIETEEEKKILKENTLFGRDATKVSTIAKKNMILHGDGHSNIKEEDSLENPVINKHKCIITNIPFSLKDVDYSHLYYNGLGKKNGDAVCVLHCLQALSEGGRMALIVPEGFLFKKELKEVRKFLLSKANLELVISLPQGVFQPYTGVKTDILYLTNAHKPEKNKEGYYYFEVKNDGFSLDAHRRKLEGVNDIYKLESNNIKKSEREILKEQGFEFIPFSKIEANDYNLVGTRYREIERQSGKWEMVKINEVCEEIKNGINVLQNKTNGKYKVSRIESISDGVFDITKTSFTDEEVKENDILQNGDILFSHINSFEHLAKTAIFYSYADFKVVHGTNLLKIKPNKLKIIPEYLAFIMKSEDFINNAKNLGQRAVNQASIRVSELKELTIPLPPLEEQAKIVEKLDAIQKSIKDAQNLMSSLKQGGGTFFQTSGNEDWEFVKIGDICKTSSGGTPNTSNQEYYNGNILWFQSGEVCQRDLIKSAKTITEDGLKNSSAKFFPKNTVLIAMYGATAGQVGILRVEATTNQAICGIFPSEKIIPEFLYYYLSLQEYDIKSFRIGGAQPNLTQEIIKNYQIPLPPLSVQKEIVEEMDAELNFIKQTETIIEKQKFKMNLILQSLWKA